MQLFSYPLIKWIRIICVFSLILLSACTSYIKPSTHYSIQNLKQAEPHYATTSNGQIEYYQFGKGTPLVLIPGYATDITSWNQIFLAKLAEHHHVVVFNNRNVARSYCQSQSYHCTDLAKDTYELIQQLELKKPAVLGISMGGMIAQQLAVLHPDKIGQLILINTAIAGKQAIHPEPNVEKNMLNLPNSKLGLYATAVRLFFPPPWRVKMAYSLALNRFTPKNYLEIDRDAVKLKQQDLVKGWIEDDVTAKKISQLQLPVLILNGKADVVIPPENSFVLAKTIPHARLIRWKEGGHAMIYQFPISIAETINRFMVETSISSI